ncbi:MAG: S9 family peptidase [Tenuifilaceae bacterium]
MQNFRIKQLLTLLILGLFIIGCSRTPEAPIAEKKPFELVQFGDTRIDPYYWLNQRDSANVLSYLNAENAYTKAIMKHTEPFQKSLFEELKSRIKEEDVSVPYLDNGYYYYSRYEEGKEYPIYCRKKGSLESTEEILLDVNVLAEGQDYCQVAGLEISPDNKILAYGLDTISRRQYIIYFKDLASGKLLNSQIINTTGSVAWANDNKTVFYTIKDESLRPYKIFRHSIEDVDSNNDKLIFHEADETYNSGVFNTKSKAYIMITSGSTLSSEYRFLDANNPSGEFKVIQPRERGLEYSVSHFGDKFYITTNLNAVNFRLMETPINKTSKENWKEIIPHREDVLLEGIDIFKNFLVVLERKDALTKLRVISWKDKSEYYVDFNEDVYTVNPTTNIEFDTPWLRYSYTSLTTPSSTIEFNMESKERKLLKQVQVLGGFDQSNYETKRLWATANDGVKIPISIVYKKGVKLDGSNPALIYGYGSYGYSMDVYFSSSRLSLLDRGFVYAIAHIRGGQELGRKWYEDGKLLKKMNTFTDFIACSEFLINEKYTSPDKLFANGGSAGGLLMGTIVNLRPDLYKGVIADVPFVDVVTTMLDTSIPLTTGEFDEWGNPTDSVYYFYMKSYSPYDQVKAQNYPNMLVTSGYHDSQVQYFEPAKWVAKLRDIKTDNNQLLFKIDMETGHGGASGRFKVLNDIAFEYAWIFNLIDIKK